MNRTSTQRRRTTLLEMEQLPSRTLLSVVEVISGSPFTGPGATKPGFAPPQGSYRPFDTSLDLAFQGNGYARPAVASGVILGYTAIHQPQYANDGAYGNGASWIGNSPNSWLKIDLGRVTDIGSIVLGRDRLGGYDDRDPGQFTIDVATSDNAYANGDSSNDADEYRRVFDSSQAGFSGSILGPQSLRAAFPAVSARYVKITFANQGAAIDEVEVRPTRSNTPVSTTTTVAASANPAISGQPVVFTATVSVLDPGTSPPTGAVTFKDGTTTLGTGALSTVNGVTTAIFTTSTLAAGTHAITASFAGDANYIASVSTALTLGVNKDLLGVWGGRFEDLLRASAPQSHPDGGNRYKEICSAFTYNPAGDSVTFYAVIGYRKKTLFSTKDTHMVWSGTMSLSNPNFNSVVISGDSLRDYDPIGNFWSINQRVALGITTFFRQNAAAIRNS